MLDIAPRQRTTYADCPACGYKLAFSMTMQDGKPLYHCHAGCDQRDLFAALRGKGQCAPRPVASLAPVKDTAKLRDYILRLWHDSLSAPDTLVARYLASRGLIGMVPPALRFLPNHAHKPSGQSFPVMLAAVTDYTGRLQAVHRTYLALDGGGKAAVAPAKMTLGAVGGFAIHLAPAGEKLVIAEGIETALSVQFETGIPAWAAISAGNMGKLVLPPLPFAREIIIAADNDPVGMKSAQSAARLWQRQGRTVRIATPPEGQDFNDMLQEVAP